MQTFYVTTATGIRHRSRAGLMFVAADTRAVHVVDATDEQIAERQAAGELVVNEAGAARILADEGLVVTDRPPPKPIPSIARKPAPDATPAVWNTIAALLGLVLAPLRAAAWMALHAALEHRAASEANPIAARLWRRIATIAAAGVDDPELLRLLAGVGADVALPELPEATRRQSASFVWADDWKARIAAQIGRAFPKAFDHTPWVDERNRVRELHAEAQIYGIKQAAMTSRAGWVTLPDAQHEQALDEWLEKHEVEILKREREAHARWMAEIEDVRLAVVAAIDHALAAAPPAPIARLALHELARAGRGMSTTTAITPAEAVDLALAHVRFVDVLGGEQ